ncbi:MAG TPA: LacI family transcriptional regulator [Firmicutes bacterium]|nr:LacI family transcriptional regulator [Bacillota bacterium]
MATIKDIASASGFSITTVSRVLNHDRNFNVSDDTRHKILSIADELNYLPLNKRHSAIKKQAHLKLGLVYWYSTEQELIDPYYMAIRLAIETYCDTHQISLQKFSLPTHYNDEIKTLHVDGLIVLGKFSEAELQKLHHQYAHLVVVDCWSDLYEVDVVVADLKQATKQMISHLNTKSIHQIGFICGIEQTLDGQELLDRRLLTYKKQMQRLKLFDPNDIYLGQFSADSGYDIMTNIIKHHSLCQAYIIASDAMAIGCLKALNEHQIKVPDVVSIISYGNISLSQFTIPSLSTIEMNTKQMGEAAIELLVERITTHRQIAKKVIIPTQLIKRDSSI